MKITLYKKCILSNSYSEVFDVFHKDSNNKVALERYLASLQKYEIQADNVYVPNSGRITLELSEGDVNVYEFNYMYLEDEDNNFRRYCFIDDITVVNGLAVISFSEDIWSNYASSMEIRKSLLVRSRATKYGSWSIPFYAPGMEYEGNNELSIKTVNGAPISVMNPAGLNILCQIQTYNTTEQGAISDRQVFTTMIGYIAGATTPKFLYDFFPQAEGADGYSATEVIQSLYKLSSAKSIKQAGTDRYFQISNVLIVPNYFTEIIDGKEIGRVSNVVISNGTIQCVFLELGFSNFHTDGTKIKLTQQGELYFFKNFNIKNDFKLLGVGTINRIIPVTPNGNNIKMSFGISYDNFSIALFLSVQNQLYEITEDFACEVPISVQTADVTQQQASARELRGLNAKLGIANGALQIRKGVLDTSIGFGSALLGGAIGGVTGTGMIIGGASSFVSGTTEIGKGITTIIGSSKELEIANRKMFTTNKAISVKQNTLINGVKDLLLYYIDANNTTEVQANIDNTGYVCNEIVDDLFNKPLTDTVATAYNVMRFDFTNIFGNFTQNIAKALRAILYNGFKIWYDETKINV